MQQYMACGHIEWDRAAFVYVPIVTWQPMAIVPITIGSSVSMHLPFPKQLLDHTTKQFAIAFPNQAALEGFLQVGLRNRIGWLGGTGSPNTARGLSRVCVCVCVIHKTCLVNHIHTWGNQFPLKPVEPVPPCHPIRFLNPTCKNPSSAAWLGNNG